jgi:hypothetical protein
MKIFYPPQTGTHVFESERKRARTARAFSQDVVCVMPKNESRSAMEFDNTALKMSRKMLRHMNRFFHSCRTRGDHQCFPCRPPSLKPQPAGSYFLSVTRHIQAVHGLLDFNHRKFMRVRQNCRFYAATALRWLAAMTV